MSYLAELERRLAGVTIRECAYDEPATPTYLTGASNPLVRAAQEGRENLGLLVQPGTSGYLAEAPAWGRWAADNGCYGEGRKGVELDVDGWLKWVEAIAATPELVQTCLFVVIPDVLEWRTDDAGRFYPVGNAAATLERSARLLPIVRKLGLPAALVAQDGLEALEVPWDTFDALFIGGSDGWKLSAAAGELCAEARRRGKWVHLGRVNSWKRLAIARALHADSADGTFLAYGPSKNLPQLLGWLDRLEADAAPIADVRDPRSSSVGIPAAAFDYGARTDLEAVIAEWIAEEHLARVLVLERHELERAA
jgi:hypothetical protein